MVGNMTVDIKMLVINSSISKICRLNLLKVLREVEYSPRIIKSAIRIFLRQVNGDTERL
jgi:hypothetical protein